MNTIRCLRRRRLSLAVGLALTAGAVLAAAQLHESMQAFPAVIPLSSLDGSDGFRTDGTFSHGSSGYSVAKAGDVNGDHVDDLIVGAPGANGYHGSAYVVFGRRNGFSSAFDLTALNGSTGFRIEDSAGAEALGLSVAGGGDINGDGFDDLVIGANGVVYVVFGHGGPFAASLDVTALSGSNGFSITAADPNDAAGHAVAIAGDVNGDGFADIVIGAPDAAPGDKLYAGSAYVVFGHAGPFASSLSLSSIDGSNGMRIDGSAAYDYLGRSVAGAGDVNGDGFGDVIVGASYHSVGALIDAGSSYVVFGHGGSFVSPQLAAGLNGSNGFQILGATAYTHSGTSVAGLGDVNGDGFDDVIVGQPLTKRVPPPADYSGRSFVVFGHVGSFASTLSLSSINGSNGFRLDGPADSYSGTAVAAAGDVNSDGLADILVGAPAANGYAGSTFVVFGHGGAHASSVTLTSLDGSDGFRLNGVAGDDYSGGAVAGVGDVDGDGGDDIVIGAPRADPHGLTGAGSSYVVFGHSDRFFADSFDGS